MTPSSLYKEDLEGPRFSVTYMEMVIQLKQDTHTNIPFLRLKHLSLGHQPTLMPIYHVPIFVIC